MTKAREIAELGQKLTVDGSGNLDIAGTIATDGLTSSAAITIDGASVSTLLFNEGDQTDKNHRIRQNGGNISIQKISDDGATVTNNMLIASNGDLSLYKNDGSTVGFTFDASTGKVGINSSNPAYGTLHIFDDNTDRDMDANGGGQIHIDGNGYAFGIALNASGAQLYTNSGSRDLIFGTNETERMRIDGNGVVAITSSTTDVVKITTESTTVGPNLLFQNTDGTLARLASAETNALRIETGTTNKEMVRFVEASGAVFNETGVDLDFRVEGSNNSSLFFVDASTDRVGISTTTPQTRLDVNGGSVLIDAYNVGEDEGLFFRRSFLTTDQPSITVWDMSNAGVSPDGLSINANDGIRFRENGGEVARFRDGNFGIGKTDPISSLHVNDTGPDPIVLERNGGTDSNTAVRYKQASTSWYTGTNGSNEFVIKYNDPDLTNSGQFRASSTEVNFPVKVRGTGSIGSSIGNGAFLGKYPTGSGDADAGEVVLSTDGAATWTSGNKLGRIRWHLGDTSGVGTRTVAEIEAESENGGTTASGALKFYTTSYNNATKNLGLHITNDGEVLTPKNPAFHAYQSAAYGITANGDHELSVSVATVNRGSDFNVSGNRFTAPIAGIYIFHLHVSMYDTTATSLETQDDSMYITFKKNGSDLGRNSGTRSQMFNAGYLSRSGVEINASISQIMSLAANDYVEAEVGDLSRDLTISNVNFLGHLIG